MQVVDDNFHKVASSSVIPIRGDLKISFTKKIDPNKNWFTLDKSTLNGSDLLSSNQTKQFNNFDAYEFVDLKKRVIKAEISRSIEFPNNIQSAILDVELNNYDGYFNYDKDATLPAINSYVLPNRFILFFLGFKSQQKIQMFAGTTNKMPSYSDDTLQMKWTSYDFLRNIGDQKIKKTVMLRDVRTDEVIKVILEQFDLGPSQYKLQKGKNIIPFVLLRKDNKVDEYLRKIVQAENGTLYQDEQGIINFITKSDVIGKQPVMLFGKHNIVSIKSDFDNSIINSVQIKAELSKIENGQSIFTLENDNGYKEASNKDAYRVKPKSTLEFWVDFNRIAWSVIPLVFNGTMNNSWFTCLNHEGRRCTRGVNASMDVFPESAKIKIINDRDDFVSVNKLELRGKAIRKDEIEYTAVDQDSIDRFGTSNLEVSDNNFFGSLKSCEEFAKEVIHNYSEYSTIIEMNVIGDPSLQLNDIITVDYKYPGTYIITSLSFSWSTGLLETVIKARKCEVLSPFILNKSKLNSPDRLS